MTDSHDHDPADLPPSVFAPVTPAPPVTRSFARLIRRPGPPPTVVPPVVPAPAAVDPVRSLIRPAIVVPPDTAAAILSGLRVALGLSPAVPVVPPPWWRRGLLGRLNVSLDLRDWALPVGAYWLSDAAGFGVLCLWVRYRRDHGDDGCPSHRGRDTPNGRTGGHAGHGHAGCAAPGTCGGRSTDGGCGDPRHRDGELQHRRRSDRRGRPRRSRCRDGSHLDRGERRARRHHERHPGHRRAAAHRPGRPPARLVPVLDCLMSAHPGMIP